MPSAQRTVRHLRLAAASAADARAVLPKLEDALRCASLPGDDQRLIIVRKLNLGRIAPSMTPQSLSRLIEARVSSAAWQQVHGDAAAAEYAEVVYFRHEHEARQILARRLLRGESLAAWYWPRAVPEYRCTETLTHNLHHLLAASARCAEARPAVRALLYCIIQAGGSAALAECLSAEQGVGLLHIAGIAMPPVAASGSASPTNLQHGAQSAEAQPSKRAKREQGQLLSAVQDVSIQKLPVWLQAAARSLNLLAQLADKEAIAPRHHQGRKLERSTAEARIEAAKLDVSAAPKQANQAPSLPPAAPPVRRSSLRAALPSEAKIATSARLKGEALPVAEASAAQLDVPRDSHTAAEQSFVERLPSDYAGVLFLLPALRQLGYADWVSFFSPAQQVALTQAILHSALQRVAAANGDPAWQLACRARPQMLARHHAPGCWQHAALRATRAKSSRRLPRHAAARSLSRWASLWLTALRRYLRRQAHIGLASLLKRCGQISYDATHIRIFLALENIALAVRRGGLDADPGWLPWYGRVSHFIYERGLP